MPDLVPEKLSKMLSDDEPEKTSGRAALVTGSVALGAYVTSTLLRWTRRQTLQHAAELAPALDAPLLELELMEGKARFYKREGRGRPLVLLHSFNAAASSYEMKPIFDHFASTTGRPLYAMDWFGFGTSDRPPVPYRPELYTRQLRRFLSEYLRDPADLVALSLASEYVAQLALDAPVLVNKIVLLSPTGLSDRSHGSFGQRALLGLAEEVGAFELLFHRLTRRESLRQFYARQVFLSERSVPEDLVAYAYETCHVHGAHYAPRRFIDGTLFLGDAARQSYERLRVPTLFVVPESAEQTVQRFEHLSAAIERNPAFLEAATLHAGLLPQWDAPVELFERLDAFLN